MKYLQLEQQEQYKINSCEIRLSHTWYCPARFRGARGTWGSFMGKRNRLVNYVAIAVQVCEVNIEIHG